MLTKFVSIGSYSPEVRTFGTLITSTKVFILQKSLTKRSFYLEILDYVLRDLTILYLEIVDTIHKHVRGCLQNLYQSVAYSPEVRTFGTPIISTKVFSLIIICKSL